MPLGDVWAQANGFLTATSIELWRRVWASPRNNVTVPVGGRMPYFDRLWSYCSNEMYRDFQPGAKLWEEYRSKHSLSRFIRPIRNPVPRLNNFYAAEIYPGVISRTGRPLPEGVPSAFPIDAAVPEPLRMALSTFLQWTNFQSMKDIIPRYTSGLGMTFVEVIDDLDRRKVTARNWWPGHLAGLTLDPTGNVKAYSLRYQVIELGANDVPTGQSYIYRKDVDGMTVTTYRDGDLYDYINNVKEGPFSKYEHGYGFAPAVLYKQIDFGDDFGLPSYWYSLPTIDELNNLVSLAHDQLAKIIKAPVVISSNEYSKGADVENDAKSRQATESMKDRERVRVMQVPAGTGIQTLPLSLGETLQWVNSLIDELNDNHPELAMYKELRQMSTVTGPAASRLMGDVIKWISAIQARYDLQTIKLCQMAVAIGGNRARRGDWGSRSALSIQQSRFLTFDLDSYANDRLSFDLMPRPLVPITDLERWQARQTQATALTAIQALGVPNDQLQLELGYTPEQIQAFSQTAQQAAEAFGAQLLSSGGGFNPSGGQAAPGQASQISPDTVAQLQALLSSGGGIVDGDG